MNLWKIVGVIPCEMPKSEEDLDRVDKFNIDVMKQYIQKRTVLEELLVNLVKLPSN